MVILTALNRIKIWICSKSMRLLMGLLVGLLSYSMTWHRPLCFQKLWSSTRKQVDQFIVSVTETSQHYD